MFPLFWHEASPVWWQRTVNRRIWLNHSKGHCQGQKGQVWLIFTHFSVLIRPAFFYFSFYEAADPVSGTSEKKKICLHDFFFISYHVIFIFEKKKKKKIVFPTTISERTWIKILFWYGFFIISDVGLTSIQIKSKSILIQKRYRFANNTFPVNP